MLKSVFLCDGQGAVKVNAGKNLYRSNIKYRDGFDLIGSFFGVDNASLSWGANRFKTKANPYYSHVYALSHQYALYQMLDTKSADDIFTGHSLGEIIALILAGGVSLADGVKWVEERGKLFHKNSLSSTSDMVALIGEADGIRCALSDLSEEKEIYVSNFNSPRQVVISVLSKDVSYITSVASRHKVRSVALQLKNGCHSKFVEPIDESLKKIINNIEFKVPKAKFYSSSVGRFILDPVKLKEHFCSHLLKEVMWESSMRSLIKTGNYNYIEVGHSKILKGLMAEIEKSISVKTVLDYGAR